MVHRDLLTSGAPIDIDQPPRRSRSSAEASAVFSHATAHRGGHCEATAVGLCKLLWAALGLSVISGTLQAGASYILNPTQIVDPDTTDCSNAARRSQIRCASLTTCPGPLRFTTNCLSFAVPVIHF